MPDNVHNGVEIGKEAVNMSREYSPDIIVLDIMMPGIDGFEACTEFREAIRCVRVSFQIEGKL